MDEWGPSSLQCALRLQHYEPYDALLTLRLDTDKQQANPRTHDHLLERATVCHGPPHCVGTAATTIRHCSRTSSSVVP